MIPTFPNDTHQCFSRLRYHPLQMLADLQTMQEHFNTRDLTGIKVAWVGDGNNIIHSFLECGAKMGLDLAVAVPEG